MSTPQSRWNNRNPHVVSAAKKRWIKRNPTRHREYNWRSHHNVQAMWRRARLRAKQRGTQFTLTIEDIKIPARCPALGIKLFCRPGAHGACDHTPTLDEIIPGRGYTRDNTAVISWRANRLKSDASLSELRAIIRYYKRSVR